MNIISRLGILSLLCFNCFSADIIEYLPFSVIRLKSIEASDAIKNVSPFIQNKISYLRDNNSILIVDFQENIQKAKDILDKIDNIPETNSFFVLENRTNYSLIINGLFENISAEFGNYLILYTSENNKKEIQDILSNIPSITNNYVFAKIRLTNLISSEVIPELNQVFTNITLVADDRTSSILFIGETNKLDRTYFLLHSLERISRSNKIFTIEIANTNIVNIIKNIYGQRN